MLKASAIFFITLLCTLSNPTFASECDIIDYEDFLSPQVVEFNKDISLKLDEVYKKREIVIQRLQSSPWVGFEKMPSEKSFTQAAQIKLIVYEDDRNKHKGGSSFILPILFAEYSGEDCRVLESAYTDCAARSSFLKAERINNSCVIDFSGDQARNTAMQAFLQFHGVINKFYDNVLSNIEVVPTDREGIVNAVLRPFTEIVLQN